MCTHESFGPKAVTEVKKQRRLCSTHSVTLLVEGRFLGRYTGICGGCINAYMHCHSSAKTNISNTFIVFLHSVQDTCSL